MTMLFDTQITKFHLSVNETGTLQVIQSQTLLSSEDWLYHWQMTQLKDSCWP